MPLLTNLPPDERLQWKLALLRHRPAGLPGRHLSHVVLGYMYQQTLGGVLDMPEHWEQAVLTWRRHGFTPASFLVLHQAVDELARLGYQMPAPPPGPPAPRPAGPPSPARRTPHGYRSWGGRPGLGTYALDAEEWAGRGDWVGSAIREIVMDVLQARDHAGNVLPAAAAAPDDRAAASPHGRNVDHPGAP